MEITDSQLEYRQYLASPIWAATRQIALTHYGCICNRCGEFGNDVHHKTYERVGGLELINDLEILCRECHTTHHQVHKNSSGGKNKKKVVNKMVLFKYLTRGQKDKLKIMFSIDTDGALELRIMRGVTNILEAAYNISNFEPKIERQRGNDGSLLPRQGSPVYHHQKTKEYGWVPLENLDYDLEKGVVLTQIKKLVIVIDYYQEHFGGNPYLVKWPTWIKY